MVVFHIFESNSQVNRWHRQPLCHSNASFGTRRKWRNQTGLKRGPSGCKAGSRHFRSVVSRSDAACAMSSYNFRRTNLCSTNVQSWHLFASRNTAISPGLIRFLRSKNTGGIPPEYTTVGKSWPLSPVPGGRGFFSVQGDVELLLEMTN